MLNIQFSKLHCFKSKSFLLFSFITRTAQETKSVTRVRFKTVCVVKHPHVRNFYQFTKIWPHGSFIPCSYNFSLTGPTTASKVRTMLVHFTTKVIFLIYVHYCVNPVAIVRTLHGRSRNFVRSKCRIIWISNFQIIAAVSGANFGRGSVRYFFHGSQANAMVSTSSPHRPYVTFGVATFAGNISAKF